VQAYLIALADCEAPPTMMPEAPDLAGHCRNLKRLAGGRDPPDVLDRCKPRCLRSLQTAARHAPVFTATPGPVRFGTSSCHRKGDGAASDHLRSDGNGEQPSLAKSLASRLPPPRGVP